MSRIVKFKVKYIDNHKRDEFSLARELNHVTPLNIMDVHASLDSAILTIGTEEELDSLLTAEACTKLQELGLKIIPPGNYKSERTIFVTKLRPFMTNLEPVEILEKINNHNTEIKATEVIIIKALNYKEGDRKSLKITLRTSSEVEKARNKGFQIEDMFIKPENITPEVYIKLDQCFRCFDYSHLARDCKKTVPTCSICAGNHNYRECNDRSNIKCVNRNEAHIAISPQCKVRQNKIRQLRQTQKATSEDNNASSAPQEKTETPNPNNERQFPGLPNSKPQPNVWENKTKKRNAALDHQDMNTVSKDITQDPETSNHAQENYIPTSQHLNSAPTLNHPTSTDPNIHHYPPQSTNNNLLINQGSYYPNNQTLGSSIKEHEWEIKLQIFQSLADRIAGENHYVYLQIMNAFLTQNGLDPILMPDLSCIQNNAGTQFPSPNITPKSPIYPSNTSSPLLSPHPPPGFTHYSPSNPIYTSSTSTPLQLNHNYHSPSSYIHQSINPLNTNTNSSFTQEPLVLSPLSNSTPTLNNPLSSLQQLTAYEDSQNLISLHQESQTQIDQSHLSPQSKIQVDMETLDNSTERCIIPISHTSTENTANIESDSPDSSFERDGIMDSPNSTIINNPNHTPTNVNFELMSQSQSLLTSVVQPTIQQPPPSDNYNFRKNIPSRSSSTESLASSSSSHRKKKNSSNN